MIEVNHLVRIFEQKNGFIKKEKKLKTAVNDVSFSIEEGEIFALLGPNGAGKTTTIKILSTLLAPSKGQCKIMGYDTFSQAKQIRSHINFIFGGESGVYRRISGRENMEYFATLYQLKKETITAKIDSLLELVDLKQAQHQKVETYSKGMIQRLQIARGLLNDPKILFLDEPTIGLDPVGARDLRNIILALKKQKKTILLTTHDMNEAEALSDRIAIMCDGKIVAMNTSEKLKEAYQKDNILEIKVDQWQTATLTQLKAIEGVVFVDCETKEFYDCYYIQYRGLKNKTSLFLRCIQENVLSVHERQMNLEDVYIRIIEECKNEK